MVDIKNKLFAKEDLLPEIRLVTALKIVSKKFCHRNFNAPAILFTLLWDFEIEMASDMRMIISDLAFSREKSHEIKEMFIKMYNDDDILLDYLNKKISDRFFVRAKKKETTEDEANASVKAIINNGFLSTFLKA